MYTSSSTPRGSAAPPRRRAGIFSGSCYCARVSTVVTRTSVVAHWLVCAHALVYARLRARRVRHYACPRTSSRLAAHTSRATSTHTSPPSTRGQQRVHTGSSARALAYVRLRVRRARHECLLRPHHDAVPCTPRELQVRARLDRVYADDNGCTPARPRTCSCSRSCAHVNLSFSLYITCPSARLRRVVHW